MTKRSVGDEISAPDRGDAARTSDLRARLMSITAFALIAGCANGWQLGNGGSAAASLAIESRSESVMDRLKQDVDRLLNTRFDDVEALDRQLGSQLGPVRQEGQFNVRHAQGGNIAGAALEGMELRSAQDDPSHATLVLELAPSGLAMEDAPWPAAVLYPPRPDAPESTAHWSLQVGNASVVFGLAPDQVHVRYISISKR
ncbi:MAG: hypothetical protein ACREPD_03170 [Stenotrophomonas sp.]|uniref:hypothetical protein n=1 Tax=Stenotrophomonas sp. TaxID=69392 RepID=UPI003D6CCE44